MAQYTKEEIKKLFETLPSELKEALLSEETANVIWSACQRNGIDEKNIPKVASLVGSIIMGLLSPDDFPEALKKQLRIDSAKAKKISQEVNRLILFPIKDYLAEFYKGISFVPGGRVEQTPTAPKSTSQRGAEGIEETRPQEKTRKKSDDTYRETVE